MKREFYDVYRQLKEYYLHYSPYLHIPESSSAIIDDIITKTVSDLGLSQTLRPDARLFLIINLHQMIALPLTINNRNDALGRDVVMMFRDDVRTILQAAHKESHGEEISGHAVINAVSRLWNELKITSLEVWG